MKNNFDYQNVKNILKRSLDLLDLAEQLAHQEREESANKLKDVAGEMLSGAMFYFEKPKVLE